MPLTARFAPFALCAALVSCSAAGSMSSNDPAGDGSSEDGATKESSLGGKRKSGGKKPSSTASSGSTGASGSADPTGGNIPDPGAICAVPEEAKAVDIENPTTVVGTGTPESCTHEAFDAAVQKGGIITFDCGPNPVTIALKGQVRINNVAGADRLGDTVIDGGGKVTLSGENQSRILYLNACEEPYNSPNCDTFDHPRLTVQNLTFTKGRVDGPSDDLKGGGGAIFVNGGLLKIVNSRFFGNHCTEIGQDVGGGAVATYLQSKPVYITGSVFGGPGEQGNSCSNGGAIASIGTSLTLLNSIVEGNKATGNGGNPGNGGNGGGIVNDGNTYTLSICGSSVLNNSSNAFGGALFYVSNNDTGTTILDRCTFRGNKNPEWGDTQSGGLYLQGTSSTFKDTTTD